MIASTILRASASRVVATSASAAAASTSAAPAGRYTPEEQAAALAINRDYSAALLAAWPPAPSTASAPQQKRIVDALAPLFAEASIADASKPWDRITLAIGMPPEGGPLARVVPDPATGQMHRLLIDVPDREGQTNQDENAYGSARLYAESRLVSAMASAVSAASAAPLRRQAAFAPGYASVASLITAANAATASDSRPHERSEL